MFADQIWWITGASSGIGAALAEAFAKRRARLVLSGRNLGALNEVARRCACPNLILPFDATAFDAVPALVERASGWAASQGGCIYGLVNNAGISQRSLAEETRFEVYQRIVAVDLLGPIALTQAVLPRLVKAGAGQIVAISSVAGFIGAPLRSAYSAAKHGLIGYHDSIRAETAHKGIKVLVVAPGSVRTSVSKNALDADGNARGISDSWIDNGMDPQIAAERIVGAVEAGKRELVLADSAEAEFVRLRRTDPESLFDRMAALVAGGYAQRLGAQRRTDGEQPCAGGGA